MALKKLRHNRQVRHVSMWTIYKLPVYWYTVYQMPGISQRLTMFIVRASY